uniref:Uncharacterized protein n=1 Tax=Globodera pallida TaxID=36090 RepID=A0A183CCP5_GLOPA
MMAQLLAFIRKEMITQLEETNSKNLNAFDEDDRVYVAKRFGDEKQRGPRESGVFPGAPERRAFTFSRRTDGTLEAAVDTDEEDEIGADSGTTRAETRAAGAHKRNAVEGTGHREAPGVIA